MIELRTSEEWSEHFGIKVLDPDGWDRKNLAKSWAEPITKETFLERVFESTVQIPYADGDVIWDRAAESGDAR